MTNQISEVKVCLADWRHHSGDALRELTDFVRSVEITVSRERCVLRGFSFSNVPDRETNPDGEIASITFSIDTPDNIERELSVSIYQYRGVFKPFNVERTVTYLPKARAKAA